MATIRIPNTLRPLTAGHGEVEVSGDDLRAVLDALEAAHPGFDERLVGEDGQLRGFVNVFVDDAECRQMDGLDTTVAPDTIISIVPAVAGG